MIYSETKTNSLVYEGCFFLSYTIGNNLILVTLFTKNNPLEMI